jgi:outer membrane protein assembly factor BamB
MSEPGLTRRDLCRSASIVALGGVLGATSTTAAAQTETPGEIRWTYSIGDRYGDGPTLIEDGTVVAANQSGTVYALDAADGSEVWTYDPGTRGGENPVRSRSRTGSLG